MHFALLLHFALLQTYITIFSRNTRSTFHYKHSSLLLLKKKEISSGSSISMDTDDVVDILSIFIGIGVLFPLLRRHYDASILRRMPKPLGWWCHSVNIYSVGSGFVFVLFFLFTISNLATFSLLVQVLSMQKKKEKKRIFTEQMRMVGSAKYCFVNLVGSLISHLFHILLY